MRKALTTVLPVAALAVCVSALLSAAPPEANVAEAAMNGDTTTIRTLIKQGADVNSAQGDGTTALHWAALKGNVELAKMLLYAGANPRSTTRLGGYTPLLMASRNGDAAMIEALLSNGGDVKDKTTTGVTPLMFAAASGHADAVKVLLDKGADVNAKENAKGETALTFAAADGRADVIRLLTSSGANVKVTTKVVDLTAYTKEEQEKFAAIVATGAPPNSGVKAEEGSQGSQGSKGSPAAQPAGRGGRGGPPQIAGVNRQYLYNELVSAQGGLTPLLLATRQGQLEAVKALLDAGADINQVSAGDKTSPILIATINGRFDVAKFLLDHGANPNLAADNGATPLYAALNVQWAPKALYPQPRAYEQQQITYLDLMKALLDKGANANARLTKKIWYSGYNFDLSGVDESGATPFWRAAYASDMDAMKLLVARGADPNIPTAADARPAAHRRWSARCERRLVSAACAARRPRRPAARRGSGRRLRGRIRGQLASLRA